MPNPKIDMDALLLVAGLAVGALLWAAVTCLRQLMDHVPGYLKR